MSISLYAQNFVVSADRMNIAYIGVDNPLTIVAEDYKCDQLLVTCGDFILTKKEDCHYSFRPDKQGTFDLFVSAKTKTGTKVIGSVKYRVKFAPLPVAMIAGKSEGIISTSDFKEQTGVVARFLNYDFNAVLNVIQFNLEIKRSNEIIFAGMNSGSLFDEKSKQAIRNVKPFDELFITGIKCMVLDKSVKALEDIHLILN